MRVILIQRTPRVPTLYLVLSNSGFQSMQVMQHRDIVCKSMSYCQLPYLLVSFAFVLVPRDIASLAMSTLTLFASLKFSLLQSYK